MWIQDDADLARFAELGVTANFTPWWYSGNVGGNPSLTAWQSPDGKAKEWPLYDLKDKLASLKRIICIIQKIFITLQAV